MPSTTSTRARRASKPSKKETGGQLQLTSLGFIIYRTLEEERTFIRAVFVIVCMQVTEDCSSIVTSRPTQLRMSVILIVRDAVV